MATKKVKQDEMTRKERQELREKLSGIAHITPEQIIEALRKEPKGQLAMNLLMDALWPNFKDAFKIGMPAKAPGTNEQQYQKRLQQYREWTRGIKSIARYWYLAGLNHKQNMKDLLSILDESQDTDATSDTADGEHCGDADTADETK